MINRLLLVLFLFSHRYFYVCNLPPHIGFYKAELYLFHLLTDFICRHSCSLFQGYVFIAAVYLCFYVLLFMLEEEHARRATKKSCIVAAFFFWLLFLDSMPSVLVILNGYFVRLTFLLRTCMVLLLT